MAAAIAQIEQGFAVFALRADAKVPVTEHGFKNATMRPDWIRRQLEAPAAGNYGLVWPVDRSDRVVVFDLDDGGGADRPWRDRMLDLVAQHGSLPPTKITTTPSGGRHAFYRWPADVPIPAGDELFGFTVRWPGRGYLVGPGSRIGDREYTAGPVTDIADLPAGWIAAALAERPATRSHSSTGDTITISGGFALPDRIPSGRRYATVRDYVASRYNAGLGTDELWELVRTQVAPRFEVAKTEAELRADFERVTAKIGERLGAPARTPRAPRSPEEVSASSIDAVDLLELDIPPLQWIVPDLLPEGTTVLAGPPKLGKSCLVYQIAVEVALGGELLGREIAQGDVLYLALEDGKRRGQTRLRAALGDRSMPRGRLEVRWSAAKLGEGLERELLDWLDQHPDARLVAIDTLQRVRARGDARRNAYEVDVEDLARLQDIFKDRAVGLIIVHHSKKDAGDDFLASVSGTYGITGSADTTLVIQRKRLETFGKLVVTGRDVQEVEEPVQFNGMTWSSAPRSLAEASFEQAEVYKVIEAEGPIFPKAIADLIGSTRDAVQKLVEKLVAGGSVARARGGYVVARVRIDEDAEGASEPETGGPAHSAHSSLAGAPAGGTTHSTHSPHLEGVTEGAEGAGTHVGAGEGRCPVCHRSVRLDRHDRIRSHRPNGEMDEAAWGRDKCPGSGELPVADAGPVLRVVRTDPTGWANPCHWYRDHQSRHRQTPSGWTCDACYPEEGPSA